jgi:hypothetical protein
MNNAYSSLNVILIMSLTLLLAPALADNYNFATMSVNLKGAMKAEFFKAHKMLHELTPSADAAANNGVQLADGAYLLGGVANEFEGSPDGEGFATKLDAKGNLVWAWKSGVKGTDACLSSAQLPNGEILVVGPRPFFSGLFSSRLICLLPQVTGLTPASSKDSSPN